MKSIDTKSSAMSRVFKKAALIAILLAAIHASGKNPVWVVTWAASQQIPELNNALPADDIPKGRVSMFITHAGSVARRDARP